MTSSTLAPGHAKRRARRPALGIVGAFGVLALSIAAYGVAKGAARVDPSSASSPWPASFAFSTSASTSEGTWATVPMGHLDQPRNTFWQLFYLRKDTSQWIDFAASLATATNGGLEIATAGSSLLVSVRSSHRLEISPVVATTDGGHSWLPGSPLLGQVNGLAIDASGRELALAESGGTTAAFSATRTNPSWRLVVRARDLFATSAGRRCDIASIGAVGFTSGSAALLGAVCSNPGAIGIFVRLGNAWKLATSNAPTSLERDRVRVLSLSRGPSGVEALLGVTGARGDGLVAAWSPTGAGRWSYSAVARLDAHAQIVSLGSTSAGGAYVMVAGKTGATRVEVVNAPGSSWQLLPVLPAATTSVAFNSGGRVDALSEQGKTMHDFRLDVATGKWQLSETVKVAILYGSSG